MKFFLGIDWGGTYIKAGLVGPTGKIIKKKIYTSKNLRQKKSFIRNIELLVEEFGKDKIKGIGIGAPGIINTKKGFIYYLPNITGWKNYPLKRVLEKRLRKPVFINNDANVFGLAESRVGSGKGKSRGIFLTLGTGLGGAVIVDGKLLEGATSAGELGHVPVSLKGKSCGCGSRGCIETYVGNKHLLSRYNRISKPNKSAKEVKDIFDMAKAGNKQAMAVWEDFSYVLGRFLAGMVNVFNPQVIVFGGGVSGAFSL
ncbi:MAG: ROK family protein, partial [Candidatus Omnitrophota bacterium]